MNSFTKVTIAGAAPIVNVYAYTGYNGTSYYGSSAALDSNGVLYMAGCNAAGQLAQGNTTNTTYGWFKIGSTNGYNTGTVAASGTGVTGDNNTYWTSMPTTLTSLQIAFGSNNPANVTSSWYTIASINSDTSITLASSVQQSYNSGTQYAIRAIPVTTAAYNTGTVGASNTAVTGTGSAWTGITANATSLQIGFGSTIPANIVTWYPIASINSNTSITLASSAGTIAAGTSYAITAIPISNPVVDFAWSGFSYGLGGVALDNAGGLWTWGYNGYNSLFYSNTSTQAAPKKNAANAQIIATTNTTANTVVQNAIYWDGSKLHIGGSGVLSGLIGITDNSFSSGAVVVSLPQSIMAGSESITDVFVDNYAGSAKLFILTDHGNLYASGDNTDGVSTGGLSGPSAVGLYKIGI